MLLLGLVASQSKPLMLPIVQGLATDHPDHILVVSQSVLAAQTGETQHAEKHRGRFKGSEGV